MKDLQLLQRAFFDPPTDGRACWDIEWELGHVSKLKAAPAIEYLGDSPGKAATRRGVTGLMLPHRPVGAP